MSSSKVMTKFKEGKLHSGSKKGPVVTNPRQAIAIKMGEERKEEEHEGKYPEKRPKGAKARPKV